MQAVLLAVDRASTIIGKLFAWCIVLLTLQVTYEVTVRYAFAMPTAWGYDVSYMLYGTLFMMAGAYTLARNGHVRGDFLYRQWPVRRQAAFDLVLYFVFFLPGMIALIVSGWDFFMQSFAQNERSAFSPTGPIVWPFKFLIPLVGVLMLMQGAVEAMRCWVALRTGQWPDRLSDVEEMEVAILEQAAAERGEPPPNISRPSA